jgi:hypothetical protein
MAMATAAAAIVPRRDPSLNGEMGKPGNPVVERVNWH